MALSITPAGLPAVPALAALASEIWKEYFPRILSEEQIVYMVEKYQSEPALARQIADGYSYFFLLDGGERVGYCGVRADSGKLFLSKLYLKKGSRGKGYAAQALGFVSGLAAKQGLGAVWLTVNRHNAMAIRAYEKNGFATVREQKTDIGGGFFLDDFVMEKSLGR